MQILNAAEMRAADAHAIHDLKTPSIELMENAARKVTQVLLRQFESPLSTAVVCGKGNNGGDGLAVARLLKQEGWQPVVLLLARSADLKDDPATNWQRAVAANVECIENIQPHDLPTHLQKRELVVDAIFGTGLSKPLEGFYAEAVQAINRAGKKVVAIDVPSGLTSDTGAILGPAIRADMTVALASLKYCHVLSPASRFCGEIHVADIGIPCNSAVSLLRSADVRRVLPHRPPDTHKGTYGHAMIVAGSAGKSGAAYLAGKAALRCGAGLSTVVCPAGIQQIVASLGPEIMTEKTPGHSEYISEEAAGKVLLLSLGKDAVAIGPGIGTENSTLLFFQNVVPQMKAPVVLDADALNLLAQDKSILKIRKPFSTILTPHPGEMSRLMQTDTVSIQKDRIGAARALAEETQSVVVLKGYRTVIAVPKERVRINPTGTASLASAGTGDILTGCITGFLAQKLAPVEAAMAGVYLHGLVANLFEARYSQQALNATDILRYWTRAYAMARSGRDIEGDYLKFHFLI